MGFFGGKSRSDRVEARIPEYSGLSDAELQYLLGLGGESADAAKQVMAERRRTSYETDLYRQQAQKAAFSALGPEFSSGLDRITGYLAGAGPLSDSGARVALARRLASDVYGRASGQIESGVTGLLGDLIRRRREFDYQRQLQQQQARLGKKSFADVAAGLGGAAIGGILGGPSGAAMGHQAGNTLAGGNSSDAYYG